MSDDTRDLVERLDNAADAADMGAWTRPGVTVEAFGPLFRAAKAEIASLRSREARVRERCERWRVLASELKAAPDYGPAGMGQASRLIICANDILALLDAEPTEGAESGGGE